MLLHAEHVFWNDEVYLSPCSFRTFRINLCSRKFPSDANHSPTSFNSIGSEQQLCRNLGFLSSIHWKKMVAQYSFLRVACRPIIVCNPVRCIAYLHQRLKRIFQPVHYNSFIFLYCSDGVIHNVQLIQIQVKLIGNHWYYRRISETSLLTLTIEIWFFIPFKAFSSREQTSMISDGNPLSHVTGANKIIWGLFSVWRKKQIYFQMEARFKVFLTMQIKLSKFEEKRLSSCYKKFLQLPLVPVKLSIFVFL